MFFISWNKDACFTTASITVKIIPILEEEHNRDVSSSTSGSDLGFTTYASNRVENGENENDDLNYGEPRIMSGNCFSVSSFISFLLVSLVTGKKESKP